jgi:hypothetical protein
MAGKLSEAAGRHRVSNPHLNDRARLRRFVRVKAIKHKIIDPDRNNRGSGRASDSRRGRAPAIAHSGRALFGAR